MTSTQPEAGPSPVRPYDPGPRDVLYPPSGPADSDLSKYVPRTWDDVTGNAELKEECQNLVHRVRRGEGAGPGLLVGGASRTGKTGTLKLTVRGLACVNLDLDRLTPCGACHNCSKDYLRFGSHDWRDVGLFYDPGEAPTAVPVAYYPVDCGRVTAAELNDVVEDARGASEAVRIIYLDEVHRLRKSRLDDTLVKAAEEIPAVWLASTAYLDSRTGDGAGLEEMFLNRFTLVRTELPTARELALWLNDRCEEYGIGVDAPQQTLTRLAERAGRIPGKALAVLARAQGRRDRTLSPELVERHAFAVTQL